MAFYLSPLVHVKEIDLTLTIPAVATSIAAIVVRNPYKGPEMQQTFVTLEEELIQIFGRPTNDIQNYRDMNAAIGYLKYGRHLYVTAVRPQSATFAGVKLYSHPVSGMMLEKYEAEDALELDDFASLNPDEIVNDITMPEGYEMILLANSRGDFGNRLRIGICNRPAYNLIKDVDHFTTQAPEPESPLRQFGRMEDGRWVWNTFYNTVKALDTPMAEEGDFLVLVQEIERDNDEYQLREIFPVSLKDMAIDDQGTTKYVENVINAQSHYIRILLSENIKLNDEFPFTTSDWQSLGGGILSTGSTVVEPSLIMDGYDLYLDPEEIDVNLVIDGDKPTTVKKYLASFCEKRMDCMAILDCMYEHVVNNRKNETMTLRNYRMGLAPFLFDNLNINTSYAALYGNWGELYDRHSRKYRWVPLSGHVAGIYAHTDWVNDPWWAPAGLNRAILNNLRRLAWNPSLGHRDILYKHGINPIVSFPGQGKVIWGQKNLLDKPSAFNRVNVRRLFIVLEKAISTASKYFLFEPNDPVTRIQLTNMIIPFLKDVKARRGVYDFLVVCDETNNTPERIDRNELWCDIYIKPVRTAEFIVLQFIATKTGVQFSEAQEQINNLVG